MSAEVADRSVVRADQVTLGVLVSEVPRDAVDDAITACGVREKRSDGKLPAHVAVYLTLGLLECRVERADLQRGQPGPETVGSQGVCRVVRALLRAGGRRGGPGGGDDGDRYRTGVVPAGLAAAGH